MAVLLSGDGSGWWPVLRGAVVLGLATAVVVTRHALVFALVGVVVGIGIGVPYVVDTGVSVMSVAGIVTLVSSIVTIVQSVRRLLRGASLRRKLFAVPAGFAVLVVAVFPLTLAVFVTNVPQLKASTEDDPADHGMAFVGVTLEASDGVTLAAWYVPSQNGAAVVLVGGATGTRADELEHAAVLAGHGYGVLLVDSRGHGDSGGDAMLWGWFGDLDVRAAVDYLDGRPDIVAGHIAAMGMSMGGEEVIGAAASDGRIDAVVAEGVSARGPRDEGDPTKGIGGLFTKYFDWTAKHAADLMTAAHAPAPLHTAIAAAAPTPILIIAGGTQPNEIAASGVFRAAAPSTVDVWIAANSGHTKAYDVHPAEWEARVLAFFDSTIGPTAPH